MLYFSVLQIRVVYVENNVGTDLSLNYLDIFSNLIDVINNKSNLCGLVACIAKDIRG